MKSIITNLTKVELQELLDTSNSVTEILEKLGFKKYSGNHRTLLKKISLEPNLDLTKFDINKKLHRNNIIQNLKKTNAIPLEDVFIENSSMSSSQIKRIVLRNNLVEYKCFKCNNRGEWMGESISLQLDHIDGNSSNNLLTNLRFCCPNCHSQTETYAGKRNKKVYFCSCGNKKLKESVVCKECHNPVFPTNSNMYRLLKFNPTKEELEKLVLEEKLPFTKIGKIYNVSDNAVRKRCKRFGIQIYNRKYSKSIIDLEGFEPSSRSATF